jgi:hypothetical protein
VSIVPVDLGVCRGYEYEGDASRTAVVLPGAMLAGMPVNAYVIAPLVERGWRVVQVWDEYDETLGREEWAVSRAEAALAFAGETRLMSAKSATTLAAGIAADYRLPAVWLTPLFASAEFTEGLGRRTARALVVGGSEDPAWDGTVARELADEVLELHGADHGLAKIEHLPAIVAAVGRFADST